MNSENQSKIIQQAKNDLEFIFLNEKKGKFKKNENFSNKINNDLEESILTNMLMEKIEKEPKNEIIFKIYDWNKIKVKKSLFYFLNKKIIVNIIANVDYYWSFDGKETAVPYEHELNNIYKKSDLSFELTYKEINEKYILIDYSDDNGMELGENNSSPGRQDLIEQYRKNPEQYK